MTNPQREGNNPYVTDAMYGPTAYAYAEAGVYYDEYRRADESPVYTCGACGADAYMKASVGTYICTGCGAMLIGTFQHKVTGERKSPLTGAQGDSGDWRMIDYWIIRKADVGADGRQEFPFVHRPA